MAMGSAITDPGGGASKPTLSYARSVKNTKFQRLNRNILEIVLEKKIHQKTISVKCDDVSKICEIVGIRVGTETEGYQAHYNRQTITLSIWIKPGIGLERFVSENNTQYSSDLTITQVRPANRREVMLLITGLSFNTPDTQVKHYVESFRAKMISVEPVYGVYREGPWRGQYNGERRYKVDFTNQSMKMGPTIS